MLDHCREVSRLVDSRMPELLRQPVVVAQFARQLLQHWDRNSQRPVSGHRKPCHRFPNFWVGETIKLAENSLDTGFRSHSRTS